MPLLTASHAPLLTLCGASSLAGQCWLMLSLHQLLGLGRSAFHKSYMMNLGVKPGFSKSYLKRKATQNSICPRRGEHLSKSCSTALSLGYTAFLGGSLTLRMVVFSVMPFSFELPPPPCKALADKAVSCDKLGPALAEIPPGQGRLLRRGGLGPLESHGFRQIREPG